MEVYNSTMQEIDQFLHTPGKINDFFTKLEGSTGIKRIYMAQGFMVFFGIYMILGHFAALICNLIGFAWPAYNSLKALETSSKDDDTRWLTYWVVYAFFSLIEFFVDQIFFWFPFYWLAKVIFLCWCFLPMYNGTDFVYKKIIRPFFLRNEGKIDHITGKIINEAKDLSDSLKKK